MRWGGNGLVAIQQGRVAGTSSSRASLRGIPSIIQMGKLRLSCRVPGFHALSQRVVGGGAAPSWFSNLCKATTVVTVELFVELLFY